MEDLSILDNIKTAVLITNRYMDITYMNAASENLFLRSKSSMINTKLNAIFAVRNNLIIGQIYDAITLNQPSASRDVEISLTNKQKYLLDCIVSIIFLKKEKHILVEINADERQKNYMDTIELHDTNTATKMITKTIAHEIKNPLGGIRGAAQLLEPELNKDQKEYTNIIISEADRLKKYVDQMLGPIKEPKKESINLHYMTDHVISLISSERKLNIEFIKDYDPSIPEVTVDKDMIIQSLLNLVKNAVEATSSYGKIIVKTRIARQFTINKRKSRLVAFIEVIDYGIGVSEELKQKIFLPLISSKEGGSGLGLSISQRLISLNDGIIEYMTDYNSTTFRIILPIEE